MVEQEPSYPLITIVMPTYNSEKELGTAIQSVLSQDFFNWNMVIVDGASSDGTLNIIRKYAAADPRISYISEKDGGVYDAMNKGIGLAKGEWIYFLGSDDQLFSDNVFSLMVPELNHAPGLLVYGNVRMGGNIEKYDGPFNFDKLLVKNIPHQATFYKRKIFNEYGFYNQRYRQHADWAFNIRSFNSSEPLFVDVLVAVFGIGGISGAHDTLFLREILIPEKLKHIEEGGGRTLKNIKSYDIVWRMIRNARFKDEQDFLNAFNGIKIPAVIKSMFRLQQFFPIHLLRVGFISKTLMIVNYLFNRIIFRL